MFPLKIEIAYKNMNSNLRKNLYYNGKK